MELLKALEQGASPRSKMLLLHVFFIHLLETGNQNIINSYFLEFAEEFLKNLSKCDAFFLPPEKSEQILEFIDKIREVPAFIPFADDLKLSYLRISNQLIELKLILKGQGDILSDISGKIRFPLIEEVSAGNEYESYSYLESITVKISRGHGKNNFIIVPSLKVVEEKLEVQIQASWMIALNVLKKYFGRIYKHHDVVINFDKKLGEYTGDSLGMAITLAFMQELFSFYNTPIKLNINSNTAFSGGVNTKGNIIPIENSEIIKSKIECVFFSNIIRFVVHKSDEEAARIALNRILAIYPSRKIKVIGVEDFDDLKNRRDIVNIKKQNIVVRTARLVYKYKVAALIVLLSLLSVLYANIDFDTNPSFIKNISNKIFVYNSNGTLLWEKKMIHQFDPISDNRSLYEMIIDADGDGRNEVILSESVLNTPNPNDLMGWVSCFNHSGTLIWKYQFGDSARTYKDEHSTTYINYLFGADSLNGRPIIYLFARNQPLYPSVIYKLDAQTGKRIPGTFWHSGHIAGAVLGNFGHSRKEIVGIAINNCFERLDMFSLYADSINGQAPALKNYTFYDIPEAKLNKFILLPRTDLSMFDKQRYSSFTFGSLLYQKEDKQFVFSTIEGDGYRRAGLMYKVNKDLSAFNIFIGDKFQVERDTLVAKGLIAPPYSNTKEYVKILKNQIKYWDGKEFIKMY